MGKENERVGMEKMNCQDCKKYATCTRAKMRFDCNCPLFELKGGVGCE